MKDDNEKLQMLFKSIEIDFKNLDLIEEALTHRSLGNENKTENINNERLEFLGDAVLELVATEFLFNNYPKYKEGILTSFRAALVKTESLAEEAKRLNLGEFLYMSKGEEATGGRNRPYILANTMEAVIGAIYLEKGYATAKEFINKNILYKTEKIISARLDIDSKSKLQEMSQEFLKITPLYELIDSTGPDHNKIFEMIVRVGDFEFGKGKGKSKQEAEQSAAAEAILNWEKLFKKYFGKKMT